MADDNVCFMGDNLGGGHNRTHVASPTDENVKNKKEIKNTTERRQPC